MKKFNAIKLAILLGGCAIMPVTSALAFDISINTGGAEVYPTAPPPAPVYEAQTPSPGPDYVWINGSWSWDNNRWAWGKGRWERPPHAGMHYAPNHYEERDGKHVYTRGGWKEH